LIVIGGGILQDLVGFCASIYARGIEYILIPTTLLAQTDSCVGGKTSINYDSRKNLLGTFYPPKKIIICTEFIQNTYHL
jgi:3-dehydroquinate synthase